jgi:hypothetical protein
VAETSVREKSNRTGSNALPVSRSAKLLKITAKRKIAVDFPPPLPSMSDSAKNRRTSAKPAG